VRVEDMTDGESINRYVCVTVSMCVSIENVTDVESADDYEDDSSSAQPVSQKSGHFNGLNDLSAANNQNKSANAQQLSNLKGTFHWMTQILLTNQSTQFYCQYFFDFMAQLVAVLSIFYRIYLLLIIIITPFLTAY